MRTLRNWCTYDFLAESQNLLERAPISKDAGLTPPVEGLSNISKYSGHLLDIASYDDNPRNQGLVGVDGACVNMTSYGPRGKSLGRKGQTSVPANLPNHLVQSIALDMLYPIHFAHLRGNVQALRHVGTPCESLYCWNTLQ
ncbi:uncharacterized protein TNCV_5046961 [Trichonephila clavipes]|nr:uncharacterized protein TNCV_5046961 [Trichonephila clavipes]